MAYYCRHLIEETSAKKYKPRTMQHDGILRKQLGKLVTLFHSLIFKVLFIHGEFLEYTYQFYFFRAIMMCTVSENQSRFFGFPENHWVHIVHGFYPTTFFQLGVYNVQKKHYLMGFPFVCSLILQIYSTKIRYNDRHRKGNHKHATERTQTTHYLPRGCFWYHVTISETTTKNVEDS